MLTYPCELREPLVDALAAELLPRGLFLCCCALLAALPFPRSGLLVVVPRVSTLLPACIASTLQRAPIVRGVGLLLHQVPALSRPWEALSAQRESTRQSSFEKYHTLTLAIAAEANTAQHRALGLSKQEKSIFVEMLTSTTWAEDALVDYHENTIRVYNIVETPQGNEIARGDFALVLHSSSRHKCKTLWALHYLQDTLPILQTIPNNTRKSRD